MQVSKGFAGALVAILAAVVVVVLLWPSSGDAAEAAWSSAVVAFRHSDEAFTARQRGADLRIARLETAAARLQDSVIVLHGRFDSLQVLAASQAAHGDTAGALVTLGKAGAVCAETIAACQARGDSLQAADKASRAARDSALIRLSQADSLLGVGVRVANCRVLLLRCPTRREAFEVGAGLGAVLAIVLRFALAR